MARDGLFYGGGLDQLLVQMQGVGAIGLFVASASFLLWLAIDKTIGLRVSEEDELVGLDISEMGMEAYPVARDHISMPQGFHGTEEAVLRPGSAT